MTGLRTKKLFLTEHFKTAFKFTLLFCGVTIALGVMSGCAPAYKMTLCPSYIVCYVSLPSIKLSAESTDPKCIVINNGSDLASSAEYGLHSSGENKERYDYLCRKHNDFTYNRYRSIGGVLDSESVTYNDCDFSGITVTADKDFDVSHPAGTDLSDIVLFMSWSPYKYISSGYSECYHYDKSDVSGAFDTLMRIHTNKEYFENATESTCYPIDKQIKDLTSEDLILPGHDAPGFLGLLYFDKTPDTKGEYNITVTISTDEGSILSDTVKLAFR